MGDELDFFVLPLFVNLNRELYQTSKGYIFNADINGALNILRKSNVVDLEVLYTRGTMDTPERIRIA